MVTFICRTNSSTCILSTRWRILDMRSRKSCFLKSRVPCSCMWIGVPFQEVVHSQNHNITILDGGLFRAGHWSSSLDQLTDPSVNVCTPMYFACCGSCPGRAKRLRTPNSKRRNWTHRVVSSVRHKPRPQHFLHALVFMCFLLRRRFLDVCLVKMVCVV